MSRVDDALKRAGQFRRPDVVKPSSAARAFEEFPAELAPLPEPAAAVIRVPEPVHEFRGSIVAAPRSNNGPELTRLSSDVEGKVVGDDETSLAAIEQYRRLAISLLLMQGQRNLRTLMISSALPRDGKTLTSANLALTLSTSYHRKVLLIDGDIRRPSLHNVFRVPNTVGLADVLRPDGLSAVPKIEVSSSLTVLPAGLTDQTTMAGLTSDRMRALLTDASKHFEWVIVDTPPVALVSDANILASLVDGVVLVVGAGATPFAAVQRAVTAFGRDRIVGVVLNRVLTETRGEGYYNEYYSWRGKEPARS
jgi:protein-tyrosine kinase